MLFSFQIDKNDVKESLSKICATHKEISKWAYILHEDNEDFPHYHVLLKTKGSVDESEIRRWFNVRLPITRRYTIPELICYFLKTDSDGSKYTFRDIISNFNVKAEMPKAS